MYVWVRAHVCIVLLMCVRSSVRAQVYEMLSATKCVCVWVYDRVYAGV